MTLVGGIKCKLEIIHYFRTTLKIKIFFNSQNTADKLLSQPRSIFAV